MSKKQFIFTRRDFLKTTTVASLGMMMPGFLADPALAADPEGRAQERIMVVIQLGGGNDGLNTVVPYGNDAYYKARPQLAIPKKELLLLNDSMGLHGELKGLKGLFDDGKLAIVNGVGYPNPNRSHFRSMEIWQTGTDSHEYSKTGWLGRYFDNCCDGSPDPAVAINVGGEVPQAFAAKTGAGISFQNPNSFRWIEGSGKNSEKAFEDMNKVNSGQHQGEDVLDFLRHTTTNVVVSSDKIRKAARTQRPTADYPTGRLSAQLKHIATLIAAGMPTRIYYTSISGFDTHAGQAGPHGNLMGQFSGAVAAFQEDLKKIGAEDRVVTMCFSEFGRRVAQNGSGGTDHGTAGPMFLVGNRIDPGIHGSYPSLTDLDDGDLKHSVDFRSVYGEMLDGWIGTDSSKVLKKKFDSIGVLG